MVESMQSIPCGLKERGLSGLGSIFGSVGVQHVNSNEKLCQQYLVRTDEMEYQIRPVDTKHAGLLPVGHEGEFRIKKDRMSLRVPEEDKKAREYQVVAMEPVKAGNGLENSNYRPAEKPAEAKPAAESKSSEKTVTERPATEDTQNQLTTRPPR
jgi:hypothetical protein